MTADEILSQPDRVICIPWPETDCRANISHHSCLAQQAQPRSYCQGCQVGFEIKKLYPAKFQQIKKETKRERMSPMAHPEYQFPMRGIIGGSVMYDIGRRDGGR